MDAKRKAIEELEQGIEFLYEYLKNNKEYQAYKKSIQVGSARKSEKR